MIIRKEGVNLIQAGLLKIVARDQYSLTVVVTGLDEKTGDQVMYDLVLSWNEVNALCVARPR
jgi:hypothetical protein